VEVGRWEGGRGAEMPLTLIRAAGGIYVFRNFEQVYLHHALSKEKYIPQKTSWEYIFLSTFKSKNGVFCVF
jgi:hypothetical protein